MAVPELYKPAWVACSQCTEGVGCNIYTDRPQSCRDFICVWLNAPAAVMGPDLKPDKCHVVFYQPDDHTIGANCDPLRPDAWRAPNVIDALHRLARIFPDQTVLVWVENRFWRIFEDTIVPTTS
jgi:uncharacterized protein